MNVTTIDLMTTIELANVDQNIPRETRACPVAKRHKAKPIAEGHSTESHHRLNPAPRTNY